MQEVTVSGTMTDGLARTFIDLLRRDATNGPEVMPMPIEDDLDETLSMPNHQGPSVPRSPHADLAAAAVMLARAIDAEDGLLRELRRGAPVVTIAVPSGDWTMPVEQAVRICALGAACSVRNGDTSRSDYGGPDRREALVFARDGSASAHRPDKGNEGVGEAIQSGQVVIGIATDPERTLPRDLVRATEYRIAIPPLDPAALALVVETVTGQVPDRTFDGVLASCCDLTDLRLSVHANRGAGGAMDRLEALVRSGRSNVGEGQRLEDMHGLGEAKAFGLALVEDLRLWRNHKIKFKDCETAALLIGPPGCGKTQFALALARSTGLPLLAGSLGQWQAERDGHLGHTLGAMRAFFEKARRAPCIALIDEIDSFGDRNSFSEHHRDYSSQVVNALLEHLDGAASREGVVVIGATNHPGRIDPAILRAGRLDRHIRIDLPGIEDLQGILRHYLGGDLKDLDLRPFAARLRGSTGADVEALVRRARGLARRRPGPALTAADLAAADATPILGEAMRLRASIHEGGHAVAAIARGAQDEIVLSIQATGGLSTISLDAASFSPTEADFLGYLVIALAGRAAEEVMLGEVSAGAVSDLAEATRCAVQMEARLGFSAEFPLVSLGSDGEIDLGRMPWLLRPVQDRLNDAYERALDLMRTERNALERIARALFREGHLENAEVRSLFAGVSRRDVRREAASANTSRRRGTQHRTAG